MAVTPIEKPFVTAQYYGDSGGSTQYWYWVQAVYAVGYGPLSTNLASVTVLSLSHSNVVSINWTPCSTAMYYNVWRTTTSAAPTTGTSQCIAQALATADGLVDNGLPGFTLAVGTPPSLLSAEEDKANAEKVKKEQEAEAKLSPADLQKKNEEAAKKVDAERAKADEAAKKESEKAAEAQDKLIEELEKTQKADDEKALADAVRAKKLDDLYKERYAPGVRETEAQKQAVAAGKQPNPASEAKEHHKTEVTEKVTHTAPGEKEPAASPSKK